MLQSDLEAEAGRLFALAAGVAAKLQATGTAGE
jgi:hypothetical protein